MLLSLGIFLATLRICTSGLISETNDEYHVEDNVGTYSFSYQIDDGTKRQETGYVLNAQTKNAELEVNGSFEFVSPEGYIHEVRYVADSRGFRPKVTLKTGEQISEKPELLKRINTNLLNSLAGGGLGKK